MSPGIFCFLINAWIHRYVQICHDFHIFIKKMDIKSGDVKTLGRNADQCTVEGLVKANWTHC